MSGICIVPKSYICICSCMLLNKKLIKNISIQPSIILINIWNNLHKMLEY